MFGTLFESRARRQRRTGGVALSMAVHLTIIGAVAATAAPKEEKSEPAKPRFVKIVPPAPTPQPEVRQTESRPASASPVSAFVLQRIAHIAVPTVVPTSLPDIVPVAGPPIDSIVIGSRPKGEPRGRGLSLLDGGEESGSNHWSGAELAMRIVTSGKPRYPEALRQAGVSGRVLVRFVVDTLGRIDPASVTVVSSTHDRFAQAVRDAMGLFRFRPAEVGGKRVQALAEMPFEFTVSR